MFLMKSSGFRFLVRAWLTDSIDLMRKDNRKLFGYIFHGTRYDIGTFKSLREADMIGKRENKSLITEGGSFMGI